jgi:hypothetical protein
MRPGLQRDLRPTDFDGGTRSLRPARIVNQIPVISDGRLVMRRR